VDVRRINRSSEAPKPECEICVAAAGREGGLGRLCFYENDGKSSQAHHSRIKGKKNVMSDGNPPLCKLDLAQATMPKNPAPN
jgi:hypothetical protein